MVVNVIPNTLRNRLGSFADGMLEAGELWINRHGNHDIYWRILLTADGIWDRVCCRSFGHYFVRYSNGNRSCLWCGAKPGHVKAK